jgi:hypothetical protein
MGESTGTLRKATIDGVTYDVMADANINFKRSKYEKEGTATSGKTLVKMTRRVQNVESLDLGCTPAEMENLSAISDKLVSVPMAFTLADGTVYRGTGHVHFEGYESETGKITVTLIPTGDWQPFLA